MESLQVSLSCTEVWFTLRALLCSGFSFLNSDIDLKVGNILCMATICFLMCASTPSTCHERERRSEGNTIVLGTSASWEESHLNVVNRAKWLKAKASWYSISECKQTSPANIQLHIPSHIHQKYWCTHGLSEIPFACSQAHYLQWQIPIWALQLPSLSLCIH